MYDEKNVLYFAKINGERRIMGFKSMSSRCTVNMKYSYTQSTRDWKTCPEGISEESRAGTFGVFFA